MLDAPLDQRAVPGRFEELCRLLWGQGERRKARDDRSAEEGEALAAKLVEVGIAHVLAQPQQLVGEVADVLDRYVGTSHDLAPAPTAAQ